MTSYYQFLAYILKNIRNVAPGAVPFWQRCTVGLCCRRDAQLQGKGLGKKKIIPSRTSPLKGAVRHLNVDILKQMDLWGKYP